MVAEQVCLHLQQPFELSERVSHGRNLEGNEFHRRDARRWETPITEGVV